MFICLIITTFKINAPSNVSIRSQRLERSNQYGIHWMYAHPIIRKCWSTVFRIGIHNSFEHSSFMKNVLMKPLILYTYVKIICGVKFCHYVFYFVNHSTVAPVVHSITLYIQYTVDFIFIRNIFFWSLLSRFVFTKENNN